MTGQFLTVLGRALFTVELLSRTELIHRNTWHKATEIVAHYSVSQCKKIVFTNVNLSVGAGRPD